MNEDNSSQAKQIVADPAFQSLLKRKKAFIVKTTIFFMIYYFSLLILVGWCPSLMTKEVFGNLNVAYLFALSQFFMAWIVAFIYVKKAAQWDIETAQILKK